MPGLKSIVISAAALSLAGCGGAATKNNQSASNAAAPASSPRSEVSATPATQEVDRVEAVNRTTSDGNRITTKELVGPNVLPADARPLRADEIEEIEKATGRPYQEGDSIHGRAQPAPKQ
jgi:hypothetical protein